MGKSLTKIILPNTLLLSLLCVSFVFLSGAFHPERLEAKNLKAGNTEKEPVLRVKLGNWHSSVKIAFPQKGWEENSRGRRIKTYSGKSTFHWSLSRKGKNTNAGKTMIFKSSNGVIQFNGKSYRGYLVLKFARSGAKVINHVGIEDYLRGVVGSEIGSRSPTETIKAQTVIARTYAYANRGRHGSEEADVCDSTHCQVYKGMAAERESIDPAVKGTRGIVMISEGDPVATLYHATCGGMTSDNDKVFGGAPRSYLRRVVCPFCEKGTNYRWTRKAGLDSIKTALRKEKIVFQTLYDVEVEADEPMDRARNVTFHTNTGAHRLKGTTIRRIFSFPSTTFVVGGRTKPSLASADALHQSGTTTQTVTMASIVPVNGDGPLQLFIQTVDGLRRVTRPEDGWKTVAARKEILGKEKAESVAQKTQTGNKTLNEVEFFGRGFGHQVGLCQAGAIELGKRNWSYRQILAFYYSNVALRSLGY